jgi:hypothetical protein
MIPRYRENMISKGSTARRHRPLRACNVLVGEEAPLESSLGDELQRTKAKHAIHVNEN